MYFLDDYITINNNYIIRIGSNFQSEESPQNDNDDGGNVIAGCRRLPDVSCLEHERKLQRIATTGGNVYMQ